MTLSKTQAEVITLMQQGWELGVDSANYSRTFVQEGGLGSGGKIKTVNAMTFRKLWRLGFIKRDSIYKSVWKYVLTDKGRSWK